MGFKSLRDIDESNTLSVVRQYSNKLVYNLVNDLADCPTTDN